MFEYSSITLNPTAEIGVDLMNQMMLNDVANEEMRKLALEPPLAYAIMNNNKGTPSDTPNPNTTPNALFYAKNVTTGVELNVDNIINSPLSVEVSVDRGGVYRFYVVALVASGNGDCIPTFQITDIDTNAVQEIGGYITSGTQSSTTGHTYTPSVLFTDRWLYGGKTYRFTVTTGLLATSSDIGYIDAYAYPPKIAYFWVQGYNGTGQQIEIPSFQVPLFSIDIPEITLPDFDFPDITFPDFDFGDIGIIDPDLDNIDFGNFEPNLDSGDLEDDTVHFEWMYMKPVPKTFYTNAPAVNVAQKTGLPFGGTLQVTGKPAEVSLNNDDVEVKNGLSDYAGGSWCHPRAYVVLTPTSKIFAEMTVAFPTLSTSSPFYQAAGYSIKFCVGYSYGGAFRSISTAGVYAEVEVFLSPTPALDEDFNYLFGTLPTLYQRTQIHVIGSTNTVFQNPSAIAANSGDTLRFEYDFGTKIAVAKINGVASVTQSLSSSGLYTNVGSVPTIATGRSGGALLTGHANPAYVTAGFDPSDSSMSGFRFGFY